MFNQDLVQSQWENYKSFNPDSKTYSATAQSGVSLILQQHNLLAKC